MTNEGLSLWAALPGFPSRGEGKHEQVYELPGACEAPRYRDLPHYLGSLLVQTLSSFPRLGLGFTALLAWGPQALRSLSPAPYSWPP